MRSESHHCWAHEIDYEPIAIVQSKSYEKYTTLETEIKDQLKFCLTVAERNEKVERSCLRTIFNSDFFWNCQFRIEKMVLCKKFFTKNQFFETSEKFSTCMSVILYLIVRFPYCPSKKECVVHYDSFSLSNIHWQDNLRNNLFLWKIWMKLSRENLNKSFFETSKWIISKSETYYITFLYYVILNEMIQNWCQGIPFVSKWFARNLKIRKF